LNNGRCALPSRRFIPEFSVPIVTGLATTRDIAPPVSCERDAAEISKIAESQARESEPHRQQIKKSALAVRRISNNESATRISSSLMSSDCGCAPANDDLGEKAHTGQIDNDIAFAAGGHEK
jgi:hypothetical protein